MAFAIQIIIRLVGGKFLYEIVIVETAGTPVDPDIQIKASIILQTSRLPTCQSESHTAPAHDIGSRAYLTVIPSNGQMVELRLQ